MPYVHSNQRRYAISRIAQPTDYHTATVPNSGSPFNFQQLLLKDTAGQNFANYSVRVQNNQGYSTGSDFATEQWLTAHDVDRQGMDFDVCSETIGRFLFYAMGFVVSNPSAGANIHSFSLQNPNATAGRQLPPFTYVEQIGTTNSTEHDVLYPSCVMDTLSISGDSLNRIMGSASFRGSGKRISPSNVNFSSQVGAAGNLNYFYNTQVALAIGPIPGGQGQSVNYGCEYDNFSFVIRNNLNPESGYRAGCGKFQTATDPTSGAVRSELLFGARDIDLSFTVRLSQSSKEYDYLQKQRLLTGSVTLTGGTISGSSLQHKLVISFDQAAMETAVIGAEADNMLTLQVSLQPLASVTNPFKAIDVTLTNGVASYLS